jgi:phospholipid/cholesterol/gamma-HCH transport system permease protein
MSAARLADLGDRDGLSLAASGAWTAGNARELDGLAREAAAKQPASRSGYIDAAGIDSFDTFGALILNRLVRDYEAQGREMRLVGLKHEHQGLLDQVRRGEGAAAVAPPPKRRASDHLAALGQSILKTGDGLKDFLAMLGELSIAFTRVVLNPRRFRFTSATHQLDRVGWQAVPIILLITFLIGCIIAQQGFFHFRKFGADDYVVDMVGILVLREFGVLIVAIMVAGRSGSAYTAELGSMKMREEIDALRTMGLDPIEVLALPRVLALIIALPALAFLGSMAALYGAGLTAWLYGGMSPDIFIARLKDAISVTHFKVGMIKAPFMALVIGIVACMEGFAVKGSAESLGRQTTASVVKAIFLVIVLDGLFAIFFASIGM